MDIYISPDSGQAVYLQIIQQLKQLIASGRMNAHQELPPIRVLAKKLLINPNTVARAYRELELAGWIYKKRGAGTFISDQPSPLSDSEKKRIIQEKLNALVVEAKQLQIEQTELVNLLNNTFENMM